MVDFSLNRHAKQGSENKPLTFRRIGMPSNEPEETIAQGSRRCPDIRVIESVLLAIV
jgi:hypothetical protein